MKGIVFTEFIQMVEEKFGLEVVDKIIESSDLESDGVYTSVGTYDHQELVSMVKKLSELCNLSFEDLLRTYGEYLFVFFTQKYSTLFNGISGPIQFLSKIDAYIHVEVKKLYPDAELPGFDILLKDENSITMIYSSRRKMSAFAHGLMLGCANHFNVNMEIETEDLSNGEGTKVKFDISVLG